MTVSEAAAVEAREADDRARAEALLRLRRGRLATAIVAGTVVLVVGVVALLGGFERRTDLLTPVAPGSLIVSGPYEVTLTRATVQHRVSSKEWAVVASGTARTTGTTSIEPQAGESGFVGAKSVSGGEVQVSDTVQVGTTAGFRSQDNLTPGLPAVSWSVTFRFTSPPGDTVLLAVFDQEYTTPYLFSSEEGWRPTRKASTFTLPLEKLPDTKY